MRRALLVTIGALALLVALVAVFDYFGRSGHRPGTRFTMAAVQSLKVINLAQEQYFQDHGCFAQTLQQLGPPADDGSTGPKAAGLIDDRLAAGLHLDYRFTMDGGSTGYSVTADPQSDSAATLHLYTDQTNVIRFRERGPASAADPPVYSGDVRYRE